jgi:SAM-dependent MidA family methyltransferase
MSHPPQTDLRQRIADLIGREGPIPFSRYMEMCLYEPGLGYYARAREQFGKAGDFYTSSDVHALYGRLLCRQFDEMWRAMGSPVQLDFIELGPGRGLFALDVLDWAQKKFPDFAAAIRYRLVETSEYLRTRLAERMADYLGKGQGSIYASLEEAAADSGESLIVFGNEFFDALPVEIVTARGEIRVTVDATGHFAETTVPARPEVLEYLDRYAVHPHAAESTEADSLPDFHARTTRVEAPLAAQDWMNRITAVFASRRGFAVFVDYGYTRAQQLAGRHLDTLMTYRQHTASPDPYQAPGEQDITTHVNFTALRAVAEHACLKHLGLVTQAEFLMGIGEQNEFADAFSEAELPQERAKIAMQLKHLVTPAGLGEIFQVMTLAHGVDAPNLAGLKFAR